MNWLTSETTKAFLLVWVLVLALYSIVAIYFGPREAAVSIVVSDFIKDNPIVALGMGVLIGHWMWRL